MITLGQKYKDKITGFEGVATSRTSYLYGCVQVGLTPSRLHDGKPVDTQFFDEQRLGGESEAVIGGPNIQPPDRVRPSR